MWKGFTCINFFYFYFVLIRAKFEKIISAGTEEYGKAKKNACMKKVKLGNINVPSEKSPRLFNKVVAMLQ